MNMDFMLSISNQTMAKFLKAVKGNYENSIYIKCRNCQYKREERCGEFLFIYQESPLLIPICDAERFFEHIEPENCMAAIDEKEFMELYHKNLVEINFLEKNFCPFHQILTITNHLKYENSKP